MSTENINKKNTNTDNNENLEDERDETRPKQLQGAGLWNLKSANQAEFTGIPVNLVLGDSNATRVHFKDPDVYNISQPGAAAAGIGSLLSKAKTKTTNRSVKRVAIHLGTVDIGRNKSDGNQVIIEVSSR